MGRVIRSLLAAAVLPGVVGGVVPWFILGGDFPGMVSRGREVACLLLMLAGFTLLSWSIVLFAVVGRGTLAPIDPPTVFVARGPYRVTRNPMYVGVTTWLSGLAFLTGHPPLAWYVLLVVACFHAFIVLVEEPGLRRRFGASYDAYCARVPRWMIPRRGTREHT